MMSTAHGEGGAALPLVSVVLATRDRPRFLTIALECYRRQVYPRRELIVVDDGDRFPVDHPTVHAAGGTLLRVPPGTPLGTKLNLGIEATSGPLCQKVDDDGWSGPTFLQTMVAALLASWRIVCQPTLAYLAPFLFFDVARWELRRTLEAHASGGTFLFQRENWRERPFRPISLDEDTGFLRDQYDDYVTGLAVRGLETDLAVHHGPLASDRGHTWEHFAGQLSVEELVRGQQLYGLGGPETVVSEWALRFYRQLRRELLAGAAGEGVAR
jgi:hypothetical protein